MLSEALRERLEQLNRAELPSVAALFRPALKPPVVSPPLTIAPVALPPPAGPQSPASGRPPAHTAGTVCENASGRHWLLSRPLADFAPRLAELALPPSATAAIEPERPGPERADTNPRGYSQHPELAVLGEAWPGGLLFLDLETCGFAGSMIFLVGLIMHTVDGLCLEQLLARNYSEERAMLETLWQRAALADVLVTFNGKSFDWPMVRDRSTLHRLITGRRAARQGSPKSRTLDRPSVARQEAVASGPQPLRTAADSLDAIVHCDLLHHARRRWRGHLPDCRLQTLERSICRRLRHGDVPGRLVPRVYHEFASSGQFEIIAPVLHHNALDLLTLVQIGRLLLLPAEQIV